MHWRTRIVMDTVLYQVVRLIVHLKHCFWEHWHGMAVDGPLSWSLACLGLKHHHYWWVSLGANKLMDNAFEEALLPNHRRRSAVTWTPLPVRWSREAHRRRASMLVYLYTYTCAWWCHCNLHCVVVVFAENQVNEWMSVSYNLILHCHTLVHCRQVKQWRPNQIRDC